jgi:hypothetical protein
MTPSLRFEAGSTPALVTFIVLAILALVDAAVFAIVGGRVPVEPAMLTVLGQIQGGAQTLAVGAVAYWVGSSVGSKTAQAALAQLAGAGAPPPADPTASEARS